MNANNQNELAILLRAGWFAIVLIVIVLILVSLTKAIRFVLGVC